MKLFVVFFFIGTCIIYSQDCPPITEWDETENQAIIQPDPRTVWGSINYDFKSHGGTQNSSVSINVDWTTINNLATEYFTNEQLKEVMIGQIINDYILEHGGYPFQGIKSFFFYEQIACYKEKTCFIKVDETLTVYCTTHGWTGEPPEYYEHDGSYYYQLTNDIWCGDSCCETFYQVQCSDTSPYNLDVVSVTKAPTILCTSNDRNCLDGNVIPCEPNCE